MASPWAAAGSGALGGAATGASIGSIIPGIGTALGAGIGGLAGGLSGFFGNTPDRFVNTQTPEQQALMNQVLGNARQMGGQGGNYQLANNYLSQLLSRDPGVYERFAAPYMQQFEQQTVPMLAERFAGLGGGMGGGALSSSGFGQALGGAGAQLQAQLANLYANLQQNAAQQSIGQYNQLSHLGLGLQPQSYQPGSTGIGGALGAGVASGLGQAGGFSLQQVLADYIKGKRTGVDQTPSPGAT